MPDLPATQRTNWRKVADRLASRLIHHAFCEEHTEITPECPFCDDIAAFRAYQEAGGTFRPSEIDGASIPAWQVPRAGQNGRTEGDNA